MAASHVRGHAKDGPPVVDLGGGFPGALVVPYHPWPLLLDARGAEALHWRGRTGAAAEAARRAGTTRTAPGGLGGAEVRGEV